MAGPDTRYLILDIKTLRCVCIYIPMYLPIQTSEREYRIRSRRSDSHSPQLLQFIDSLVLPSIPGSPDLPLFPSVRKFAVEEGKMNGGFVWEV